MAIAPKQPINAALGRVDSSAPLQAELATGPIRTAAKLEAGARKIKAANEAMAEFKQKREEKKLKDQTVAYIKSLNEKKDPATQQVLQGISVNMEDNAEVGRFIDVMGGPKNTMDTILQSIQDTQELFREAAKRDKMASGISQAYTGGQSVSGQVMPIPSGSTASAKGQAVLELIQQGNDLDTIKEYLSLLDFEDPKTPDAVDVGAEVMEDFKNMKQDAEDNGPYVINFQNGKVKYKGKGISEKEIKPGDKEYENLRRMYPDGVAELDRRRAFRASQGADESTEKPIQGYTEEELNEALSKY